MTAELVADLERALAVEPGAQPPLPGGGHAQGLGCGIHREYGAAALFAHLDHREADARARDRSANGDRRARIGTSDLEPGQPLGPRLDCGHLAYVGGDAGEHY